MFLKEYETGEILMDGSQPFLPDILTGDVEYTIKRHPRRQSCLRAAYARQMRNALSHLQETQYGLLNKPLLSGKVGSCVTIKSFLKNLKIGAATMAKRQANAFLLLWL